MIRRYIFVLLIATMVIGLVGFQDVKPVDQYDPLKDLQIVEQVKQITDQYKVGFESITKQDAEAYLRFISSDLLAGRETAQAGYAIACEYAASLFASWGLQAAGDLEAEKQSGMFDRMANAKERSSRRTYYQNIALREKIEQKNSVTLKENQGGMQKITKLVEKLDYTFYSSTAIDLEAPVVFIGYGLNVEKAGFNEYKGLDVKGKVVMILEGKPEHSRDKKRMTEINNILKEEGPSMRRRSLSPQFKAAQKAGALAVITVSTDPEKWLSALVPSPAEPDNKPIIEHKSRSYSLAMGEGMVMPWETVPRLRISTSVADELLKPYGQSIAKLKKAIDAELKPNSFFMGNSRIHFVNEVTEKVANCRNVLALIEGSDPVLKNELVVIGAHLDHLGQQGAYIYNGADDNGSGAVAVLEVAQAFAQNPIKPKRSVLFALWTGEEKGLLGSRYYVAHPYNSLKQTHAYLNLDMLSRIWDKKSLGIMARMMKVENIEKLFEKIDLNKFASFSYLEGPKLGEVLKHSNEYVGLQLLLRPTKDSMGGSDHWPFGNAGVPWVFFMAAMTDDYHQPGDEVQKCSFALMQSINRLTYLTAAQLAQ